MVNGEFLAWAAGFFDGEGTIVIQRTSSRQRGSHVLQVQCYQTERAPLDEMRERWGGAICKLKTRVYNWQLGSKMAEQFLRDIRPYCRVKGPEIDIALQFRATVDSKNRHVSPELAGIRDGLRVALINHRKAKYGKTTLQTA